MTKSQQGKLRELHTAQMTVSEIAEELNLKKSEVRKGLVEMGYVPIEIKQPAESEFLKGKKPVEIPKRTYQKMTKSVEKQICELREQCFTIKQITQKLNLNSENSVRAALQRNGYSTQRGKYHKENKNTSINKDFEAAIDQMIEEAEIKKEDKPTSLLEDLYENHLNKIKEEPATSANDASSEQGITPVIPDTNNITEQPKSQALTGIGGLNTIEGALDEWLGNEAEIVAVYANKGQAELTFVYAGQEYVFSFGQKGVPEYDTAQH